MRKIRKVTLIEPKPAGYHVYSRFVMPRLGLPLLGAILKKRGIDVKIYCQDLVELDFDDICSSDLVGISTTTSTVPEAYRLADRVRATGVPVVFGGSHVTFRPEEALEHGDYCVRGEGEDTLSELIDAIESGEGFGNILGLSYRHDGGFRHNPDRERVKDLDSLPFPDMSLIAGSEKVKLTPIATSRGCPFACQFCSVTRMFGRTGRFRSIENVITELTQLQPEKVFFYDDNFAINKKHTKDLLRAIKASGLKFQWTAQVRADVAKDKELLELMKETNCNIVYIGFESVNPETLKEYKKSQDVEDIIESIRVLHNYGIMIHGMFVIGADNDTAQTIRETVRFALKHRIDTVQFMVLTPLPGTPYYQMMDESGRILTRDWTFYDGAHTVFQPSKMSPYELQKEMILAMKRFYSLRECVKMIAGADFWVFLAKFNMNLLLGRWRSARRQFWANAQRGFFRAYGHFLLKKWMEANHDFSERAREFATRAREITNRKTPGTEGMD